MIMNMMEDFVNYRDIMIFGNCGRDKYSGGIRRFNNVTEQKLAELIESEYVDLAEKQNDSPTVKEFYDFMCKYPGKFVAEGYVTFRENNTSLVIEGLGSVDGCSLTREEANDFWNTFNNADNLSVDHKGYEDIAYCWYD